MPAPGGPANQSGVGYQNAVAALYLGRLSDGTERPPTDTVREVRLETRGPVDDVEVTFASGAHRWIQAKERVSVSSGEWKALWAAFIEMRGGLNVTLGDRLVLWLGSASRAQDELREAALRGRGARNAVEWWSDLSRTQQDAVSNLETITEMSGDHIASLDLLRAVEITIVSREQLREWVPFWIPAALGATQHALYDVLQTQASEAARYRTPLMRANLLAQLRELGIEVLDPIGGESQYRDAINRETATMTIPGTTLRGATSEVFRSPRMSVWHPPSERGGGATRFDPRDVDDVFIAGNGEPVRFEDLPTGSGDRVVILAGAGAGKSALLIALVNRLSRSIWIPAYIRLADFADHGGSVIAFLEERLNPRYATNISWVDLCDRGTALLLFDGLDELAPHLRPKLLDTLQAFSSRFPRSPWILTVRDMAGAAAPVGARIVELLPLADDAVEAFCSGWLPPDRASIARELAATISVSRELRRMARIPFLLALMLGRVIDGGSLPTRRSDLLDQYVEVLLRPENWKPGLSRDVDTSTLRAATEMLAFATLDSDETDITARTAVSVTNGTASDTVLDALVARGLFRDSRVGRYGFVFPILQEYLAGCRIASQYHGEIVRRFEAGASRPWAQALQFAVEVSDSAESIAVEVLDTPDDAFRTKLKILGRCAANGARLSSDTRARIGEELALVWISEDREGAWTGRLLADGYGRSLPPAARGQLCEGRQLDCGGADLIAAAEDPALTEAALRAILKNAIPGHVTAWQSAIDAIAPTAARLYLERATNARTEREIHWLAYLLGRVTDVRSDSDPRRAYAGDSKGDPFLRLACLLRLSSPPTADVDALIVASFDRYVRTEADGETPMLDVVFDASFRLSNERGLWRTLLDRVEGIPLFAKQGDWWLFGLSPSEAYWRTVVFAPINRTSNEEARGLVSGLEADNALTQTRRDYLELILAYLGDDDAFSRVGGRLADILWRDVTRWIFLASGRPAQIVEPGLRHLRTMSKQHRVDVAGTLAFSFSYDVEMLGFRGGARGKSPRRHPAADAAVELLTAWAGEAELGSAERFGCLAAAVSLGAKEIAATLLSEIVGRMSGPIDPKTDDRMADALSAVGDVGFPVTFDLLVRAANVSTWNLRLRAFDQLGRLQTPEALDALLTLHASAGRDQKRILNGHIERLARALAVRIAGDRQNTLSRLIPGKDDGV